MLKTPPLVTVVMATYNSSQTLKLAIETVLAQDFTDYEVWVVGDACTDNSQQVVESFVDKRLNWTNLEQNSGSQGAPNNEGIRRARGQYIAYLGHDDLWFPWHLSTLVSFIQESDADLVHPLSAVFSPAGLKQMVGPPSTGRSYASHFVFPSCWLHKKQIISDCGLWGDYLKLDRGVDHDFLQRVHLNGKKIAFYPRLSLLKFPSVYWGTYASDYNPGQLEYLIQMRISPQILQQEILTGAATLLARQFQQKTPLKQALNELRKSIFYRFVDIYGSETWPIPQLMKRRFRRTLKS